jgi:hypothetical protein
MTKAELDSAKLDVFARAAAYFISTAPKERLLAMRQKIDEELKRRSPSGQPKVGE